MKRHLGTILSAAIMLGLTGVVTFAAGSQALEYGKLTAYTAEGTAVITFDDLSKLENLEGFEILGPGNLSNTVKVKYSITSSDPGAQDFKTLRVNPSVDKRKTSNYRTQSIVFHGIVIAFLVLTLVHTIPTLQKSWNEENAEED